MKGNFVKIVEQFAVEIRNDAEKAFVLESILNSSKPWKDEERDSLNDVCGAVDCDPAPMVVQIDREDVEWLIEGMERTIANISESEEKEMARAFLLNIRSRAV